MPKLAQDTMSDRMKRIRALVERQANDEGCWFQGQTCAEAYLQGQLRMLHATIEGTDLHGRKLWTEPDADTVYIAQLRETLELAAGCIRDLDGGDQHSETGWKSEELLGVWMRCQLVLGRGESSLRQA